ncbi:hypothetical protein ACFSKU_15030 [Pontibacter silvestris]|uniref:Uncharacterized protein n=1 Tax=Pontibacter silvestris TaxID=2305183 RepID=A0ABW4X0J6_9BACT
MLPEGRRVSWRGNTVSGIMTTRKEAPSHVLPLLAEQIALQGVKYQTSK